MVPAFYQFLHSKTEEKQEEARKQYIGALEGLVELFERAERETTHSLSCGLWRENGGRLGMVDVMLGPCECSVALIMFESCMHIVRIQTSLFSRLCLGLLRSTNVLKQYRNFAFPANDKFSGWIKRLFEHPSFAATCSTDDLYLDSYRRCVSIVFFSTVVSYFINYVKAITKDTVADHSRIRGLLGRESALEKIIYQKEMGRVLS